MVIRRVPERALGQETCKSNDVDSTCELDDASHNLTSEPAGDGFGSRILLPNRTANRAVTERFRMKALTVCPRMRATIPSSGRPVARW
jgi:hypothetical protein